MCVGVCQCGYANVCSGVSVGMLMCTGVSVWVC